MSKFNFKSQICTTREQSERLLKLGLKKETADMHITNMSGKGINYTDDWQIGSTPYCNAMSFLDSKGLQLEKTAWSIVPAWSLHRLIEMMPEYIVLSGQGYISIREHCVKYVLDGAESNYMGVWAGYTLYDKLINCIEWLIKEGHFKADYLCSTSE